MALSLLPAIVFGITIAITSFDVDLHLPSFVHALLYVCKMSTILPLWLFFMILCMLQFQKNILLIVILAVHALPIYETKDRSTNEINKNTQALDEGNPLHLAA